MLILQLGGLILGFSRADFLDIIAHLAGKVDDSESDTE